MVQPTRALQDELRLVRAAVLEAGEAVLEHFRTERAVRFKSPDQPVTDADLLADRILRERLLHARPDFGWLSEETADSPERLQRRCVWIVDPIDGTNSFVEGRPEFVLSVGLAVDGEAVLGVVHNPATGELFHAVRGAGAFRDDRRITVAPLPPDQRGTLLASRSEMRRGELQAFAASWRLEPLGSTAYRMVKVADGSGHLFLSAGRKHEWDVCGATVVLREAGGQVTQIDGGPLRFNQPEPEFRGVIAAAAFDLQRLRPALGPALSTANREVDS